MMKNKEARVLRSSLARIQRSHGSTSAGMVWLSLVGLMTTVACQDNSEVSAPTFATNSEALVSGGSFSGGLVADLHEPVKEACLQEDLLALRDRAERAALAFECGDLLFEFQFNAVDGAGANVGDGLRFSRVPRADKTGVGEWFNHFPARETGPNAEACNHCHSTPPTGAGPAAVNVVRDPRRNGKVGQFIQRNTAHLMGSGAVQLLAEEITTELKQQRDAIVDQACSNGYASAELFSKEVSFGRLSAACVVNKRGKRIVKVNTKGVKGVSDDLIVRPFQWKGANATLRDFNRGAAHNELGMQPVETTGESIDGDGDGVVNEFGIGDMTAMAVYVAGQARPITMLELDDLGLLGELGRGPLSDAERVAIQRGEEVFAEIGCADCHTPRMLLNNPVFSEPSQHPDFRDSVFPAGQDPVAMGVDPLDAVLFDLTQDQPDNVFEVNGEEVRLGNLQLNENGQAVVELYGDLRRHDMGFGLAENVDETGTGAGVWLTKELWGVGTSAPYLHDGRATTVTEAILAHGGEGAPARGGFVGLEKADQQAVVAFLENLVLLKVE